MAWTRVTNGGSREKQEAPWTYFHSTDLSVPGLFVTQAVQQAAGPAGDVVEVASTHQRLSMLEKFNPGHCSEPKPPNQSPMW